MERHCAWRLWIIEFAWAHNMMEVLQDVGTLYWPDGDWGIMSLDESWHVRLVSAQVYNIIKSRQTRHYEKVLGFLEHSHTLVPTLVPAIKHMKIVFGLKTMVIVWMLREGIGSISVVQKIIKYFPSKLPQYEDHCRKHEMLLMRRNHLDFKTFAQSLIMDKEKLENYIKNHVEEHYGDHYAQKTEERLLHYLRELDRALPKCTYIDKMMKKNAVKECGNSLLDLITDDSTTTATRLKTLLQSDTCCYSHDKLQRCRRNSSCMFPESRVGTFEEQHKPAPENSIDFISQVDTFSLINDTAVVEGTRNEQVLSLQTDRTEMDNMENCPSNQISPHFCSRHQRWVQNILSECPMESSEELLHQDISPPLFTPSSSSASDLTPSNLTTRPEHRLTPPPSTPLQAEEEDPKSVEKHVSEPVDLEPPLHPASPTSESLISGGRVLKVVIVPCNDVTPVTVCPVKTRPDLQVFKDSTTASFRLSNSSKPSTQTVITSKPFISKLSRRFRLGQTVSQSQRLDCTNKEEEVQCSQMRLVDTGGAANLSPDSTSRTDVLNSTHSSHDATTFNNNQMQPRVVLKRMSTKESLNVTKWQCRQCDETEEQWNPDIYTFDVNSLYSDCSSGEETDSDTEYKPSRKTLRRWSRGLLPF